MRDGTVSAAKPEREEASGAWRGKVQGIPSKP